MLFCETGGLESVWQEQMLFSYLDLKKKNIKTGVKKQTHKQVLWSGSNGPHLKVPFDY